MPSIEQNLAAILAAKYGKDVRQAIHDSIEQNYEDVVNGRIYMDGATDNANMAAQEALDNIVISASFSGDNINFTKANNEVITLLNAKSELRGETGLNMNGSSGALLFVGDEASAKAQSIEVTFSASLGGVMYGVTIVAVSGLPAGMTYAISLNGSTGPKVTFTSTTSMVSPYGLITVACVSVPNVGSRAIKIPYAIAFKGEPFRYEDFTPQQLLDLTGPTGANSVYVGAEEPTDPAHMVWIDDDDPYDVDYIAEVHAYIDSVILGGSY